MTWALFQEWGDKESICLELGLWIRLLISSAIANCSMSRTVSGLLERPWTRSVLDSTRPVTGQQLLSRRIDGCRR